MAAKEWRIDPASLLAFSDAPATGGEDAPIDGGPAEPPGSLLSFPRPAWARRQAGALAASAYARLGERWRWAISSFLKKCHFWQGSFDFRLPPSPALTRMARLFAGSRYDARPAVILLTHDVDYVRCHQNVMALAEKEARLGIASCFYFLVRSHYEIDGKMLGDLVAMGHEVGLHGLNYDLRLAYRSHRSVLRRIRRARGILEDLLGGPVHGFRNHSLQSSRSILEALEGLGFEYDSGLYPREAQDGFTAYYCWPFRYLGSRLYEVPVLWPQDMEVFRMSAWPEDLAFEYFRDRVRFVEEVHGAACLDMHPSIIADHPSFFDRFLDFVRSSSALVLTPHRLVGRAETRRRSP